MKLLISIAVYFIVGTQFAVCGNYNFGDFLKDNSYKTSSNKPTTLVSTESGRFDDDEIWVPSTRVYELDFRQLASSPERKSKAIDEVNSTILRYDISANKSDSISVNKPSINESFIENNTSDSSSESTTSHNKKLMTGNESTTTTTTATTSVVANISASNTSTNTDDDEQEEVVLSIKVTTNMSTARTIIQKSIDFVEDPYILSILIPITAGVVFATTIIIMIAMCRCIRRCCRRRRFRKKILPDSVKGLRSDRARLLGGSSDEEF